MEIPDQLAAWALSCLPCNVQSPPSPRLEPLAGDAGFRRYFRLNTTPALMAVHAPPEHEDVPAFVAKDLAFKAGSVRVPAVYAVDYRRGFMLQEDLGRDLLLPSLDSERAPGLYAAAEAELTRIQAVSPNPAVFPPYHRPQLEREMALFPQWFLEGLLGLELAGDERALLRRTFNLLVESATEQPQVVVHRDYHSRNLLLSAAGEIGVIDFQDALVGAFTYDLVSLLKDCYIRWPSEMVRLRAIGFLRARMTAMGAAPEDDRQLLRWFDLMGLQRHVKVLGIFARLWLRDGKRRYLDDLPLVLRYTLEVTAAYTELKPFHHWFGERVLPQLPHQSWYRDWTIAGE